ncbi:MAG: DUF1127 domain-containing protein [Rhizobiaceae bacterium]|nr:DUF1127 domain-containing protein [Rhizobiaceae bacterium]
MIVTLAERLRTRMDKRRSRSDLAELTRDQLADIGLTPAEARTEVQKSWFWG